MYLLRCEIADTNLYMTLKVSVCGFLWKSNADVLGETRVVEAALYCDVKHLSFRGEGHNEHAESVDLELYTWRFGIVLKID